MTFVPTAFAAQFVAGFALHGQTQVRATIGFNHKVTQANPTPIPATTLADLRDKMYLQVKNNILPLMSQDCDLVHTTARDISQSSGQMLETFHTDRGGVVSMAAPLNTAIVTTWRTARNGRSFRGRTYLPFWPRSIQADDAHVTVTDAGVLDTAWDTLLSNISAQGYPMQVLSRFSGVDGSGHPIPRSTGVLTVISGHSTNTKIDTQRRRLRSF